MHICYVCKKECDCRIDWQDTANGPLFEPVCYQCYAKDVAERKGEGKRFGYRPKIVPWEKLEGAAKYIHPTNHGG